MNNESLKKTKQASYYFFFNFITIKIMSEQILIYSLSGLFIYAMVNGCYKGGTSELISLLCFIIGFLLAIKIFENTFYTTVISIIFFLVIYNVGNFISFLFVSHTTFEKISGIIIGGIKFFTFLTALTIILLFMDSAPETYLNILYVQIISAPAKYLKDKITKKKRVFSTS